MITTTRQAREFHPALRKLQELLAWEGLDLPMPTIDAFVVPYVAERALRDWNAFGVVHAELCMVVRRLSCGEFELPESPRNGWHDAE